MDTDVDAPSLSVVRAEIDLQLVEQQRQASDLDSRAGLIIGFAGVLIGLSRDVQNFVQGLALVMAGLASLAGAVALWPRVTGILGPRFLRDHYLDLDARVTAVVLLDTRVGLLERDAQRLDRKAAWVKFAVAGLGVSTVLMLAGAIVEYLR